MDRSHLSNRLKLQNDFALNDEVRAESLLKTFGSHESLLRIECARNSLISL